MFKCFYLDVEVDIPGIGKVLVDISYGGQYYVVVPAERLGLDIHSCPAGDVAAVATAVLKATREAVKEGHPDGPDLNFPNGTVITDGEDQWSDKPTTATVVCDGSLVSPTFIVHYLVILGSSGNVELFK